VQEPGSEMLERIEQELETVPRSEDAAEPDDNAPLESELSPQLGDIDGRREHRGVRAIGHDDNPLF